MASEDTSRQGFDPVVRKEVEKPFNKPGLVYLYEIFAGTSEDPLAYLGETPKRRDESINKLAERLASGDLRDRTQQFLDHLEELRDARIAKGRTINYLEKTHGVDDSLVENIFSQKHRLLLVLYSYIYKSEQSIDFESVDREFRNFLYSVQFYTANTEVVYHTDEELPDFERVKIEAQRFEKRKNRGRQRAFRARVEPVEDEILKIRIFEELPPRRERIFKFRKNGIQPKTPDRPTVSRTTTYPIKTFGLNVHYENNNGATFIFSENPEDRWRSTVEEFLEDVFEITDPFDTLERRKSEVAVQIEDTASEAAADDKKVQEVVRDVQDVISSRTREVIEQLKEMGDKFDGDMDQLQNLLHGVELAGIRVVQDQSTATGFFELRPRDSLLRQVEFVEGLDDALLTYLERADDENVRPILQVKHEDGTSEKIILEDGNWSSLHGALSDETTEALNHFFDDIDNDT